LSDTLPGARPVPPGGPAPRPADSKGLTRNMTWVAGGGFLMGSADFYRRSGRCAAPRVDGFWMDDHPVTVAEFRRFVRATGYVTVAERPA